MERTRVTNRNQLKCITINRYHSCFNARLYVALVMRIVHKTTQRHTMNTACSCMREPMFRSLSLPPSLCPRSRSPHIRTESAKYGLVNCAFHSVDKPPRNTIPCKRCDFAPFFYFYIFLTTSTIGVHFISTCYLIKCHKWVPVHIENGDEISKTEQYYTIKPSVAKSTHHTAETVAGHTLTLRL